MYIYIYTYTRVYVDIHVYVIYVYIHMYMYMCTTRCRRFGDGLMGSALRNGVLHYIMLYYNVT